MTELPFQSTPEVEYILPGVTGTIASTRTSAADCASAGGEDSVTTRASDGPNAASKYPRCRYTGSKSNLAVAARVERLYSAPFRLWPALVSRPVCSDDAPG